MDLLIDPYDNESMIEKFKGCINEFKSLETTAKSISNQHKEYNNRQTKLAIKAIVCYVKWVATVRTNYPNPDQLDHCITIKKNTELTKILYYNSNNFKENYDKTRKLCHQRGYKSCKNLVNSISTAVNYILKVDDLNYYNFITSSSLSDSAMETSLLANSDFLIDTSLKSDIIDKPKFKYIDYDEEKDAIDANDEENVIDANQDDDDDEDQYLVGNKFKYPFQVLKIVNKVTKYFENVHSNTFKSGTSSLGDFNGVDGMWTTAVVIEVASVLNDVFRNNIGDIFGIDFGHGSALTMFTLLESLNSSKFNMIGLEVCSLYIIYYFSFS
jgi:hypothetical protein